MKILQFIFSFLFFSLTILTAITGSLVDNARAVIVDRIVAVVNNDVITLSELEDKARPVLARFISPTISSQEAAEKKQQILAQMLPQLIDDTLVRQEIEKKGMGVSDQEVDQGIENICRQNGITREEFEKKLTDRGYALDKYKEQVKIQIERSRLIASEVRSKIVVTDDEIKNYYVSTSDDSTYDGPYYELSMINIAPEDPEDSESRARAEKRAITAYKRLSEGISFEETADENCGMPPCAQGGRLGKFSADEMDPFIRKIILQLKPGEFSKIIDMPSGYQIFKLNSIANTQDINIPEDEKEELRKKLYDQKMEERFQEWLNDLREKSAIKIML